MMYIKTKIVYSVNRVLKARSLQKLNTFHHLCELEGTQLLIMLATSVQNPDFASYLLTGNRGNFLYVEGTTA